MSLCIAYLFTYNVLLCLVFLNWWELLIGKHLRFDVEKVWKWFDRQPGADGDDIDV